MKTRIQVTQKIEMTGFIEFEGELDDEIYDQLEARNEGIDDLADDIVGLGHKVTDYTSVMSIINAPDNMEVTIEDVTVLDGDNK